MLTPHQIAILTDVSRHPGGLKSETVARCSNAYPDRRFEERLWLREVDVLIGVGYLRYVNLRLEPTAEGKSQLRSDASVLMRLASQVQCVV